MTAPLDDDTDGTPTQDAALTGDEPSAAQDEPVGEDAPEEATSEPCGDDPVEGSADDEAAGERHASGAAAAGDETAGEGSESADEEVAPAEDEPVDTPDSASGKDVADEAETEVTSDKGASDEPDGEAEREEAADEPVDGELPDGEAGSEADDPVEDAAVGDAAVDGGSGADRTAESPEPVDEVATPTSITREAVTAEEPAAAPDDAPQDEALDGAADAPDASAPDEDAEEADLPELPPSFPPKVRPVPLPVPGAQCEDDSEPEAAAPRRGSTLMVIVLVLVLTALIKTFVVQAFEIPSSSMESTLETGDRVVVTMYDADQIERGDIVVFHDPGGWLNVTDPTGWRGLVQDAMVLVRLLPEDTGHHLIKRVIGLPGDHVVADSAGAVSVNGATLEESYLKAGSQGSEVTFDIVVPDGCVWVMGDNRSNSLDSRYHQGDAHGGAVPLTEVVGVAKGVLWPIGHWSLLNGGEEVFTEVPSAEAGTGAGPHAENEP